MFDRFWKDWNRFFKEMNKDFEEMFKKSVEDLSKNPEDSRTWGFKLYWDNSMENPVVKYFGNVDPTTGKLLEEGWIVPSLEKIFDPETNLWRTIVELPGVKKQEIKLTTSNNYMNCEATSKDRKYRCKVDFDRQIDPETVKAMFNNGLLTVTVKDKSPPPSKEHNILIE